MHRPSRSIVSRRLALRMGLAIACLSWTSACGFRPLYGRREDGSSVDDRLKAVEIGLIADRRGQILRNLLVDRFHRDGATEPVHRLSVELQIVERSLGIQVDATATRAQLKMTTRYRLDDIAANKVVFRSSSRVVANYNVLSEQFATIAAEESALQQGLVQLSERVASRIGLFLNRLP